MTEREKIIYDILCSDEQPPEGQHWEGFVTNKIVAALAQPEPEPVAWGIANTRPTETHPLMMVMLDKPEPSHLVVPLYTAPPQREVYCGCGDEIVAGDGARCGTCVAVKYKEKEWQGLTDEEYEAMAEKHVTNCYFDTLKYAKAIEAKLKGKNSTSVMNQQTSDKND